MLAKIANIYKNKMVYFINDTSTHIGIKINNIKQRMINESAQCQLIK